MISGIYKIVNKINSRIYIGSSLTLQKRLNRHFNELRKNKHNNKYLQNDFNKCGEENFTIDFIEKYDFISLNDLLNREQYYINKYFDKQNKCYNINPLANSPAGLPKTEEAYWKMIAFTKSPEFRKKMSDLHKGKILSIETRQKMSNSRIGTKNSFYGKTHKPSTKKKISELAKIRSKGKKFPKTIRPTRPIISTNLITKEIIFFPSIKSAAEFHNIKRTSIGDVLSGNKKSAKKKTLKFEYQKSFSPENPK